MHTIVHQELGNVGIRVGMRRPSSIQDRERNTRPPQSIVETSPSPPKKLTHSAVHKVFGLCEVIMGTVCLILEIASFCVAGSFLAPSHSGLYVGIFLFFAGIIVKREFSLSEMKPFLYLWAVVLTFFACFIGLVISSIEAVSLKNKRNETQLLPSDARMLQESKLGVVILCCIVGGGVCMAQTCLIFSSLCAFRDSTNRINQAPAPAVLVAESPIRPSEPRPHSYIDATPPREGCVPAVTTVVAYHHHPYVRSHISPPAYDEIDDISQISLPPSYTTIPRRH